MTMRRFSLSARRAESWRNKNSYEITNKRNLHACKERTRHHMFDFPSFHIRIVLERVESRAESKCEEKHPKNILIHENEPFPSINFNKTICRLTNLNARFFFLFWVLKLFFLSTFPEQFVCCDRRRETTSIDFVHRQPESRRVTCEIFSTIRF